jgi:hypothetical protein
MFVYMHKIYGHILCILYKSILIYAKKEGRDLGKPRPWNGKRRYNTIADLLHGIYSISHPPHFVKTPEKDVALLVDDVLHMPDR